MSSDLFSQESTRMRYQYAMMAQFQGRRVTRTRADLYASMIERQIDHLHHLSRPGYLDGPGDFGPPHASWDDNRRIAWIGCGHEKAYLGTRTYWRELWKLLKLCGKHWWAEVTGETYTYIENPRMHTVLTGITA